MLEKIKKFIKNLKIMTTSYSIGIFASPLSSEEENNYINKCLEGDKNARNKLIEHNLRLVAHIVKKYETINSNADDLISIGTIGLIKGIDSYRPNKGVKLTTYIAKCAENEILMYFRSNKKNNSKISLNTAISHDKDGGEITLMDILKEQSSSLDDEIELKDNIKNLSKYIKVLNNKELEIIKMRYGLFNEEEKTQKEISNILNISRSYVSRIEKRALIKILREFIKNNNV